MQCYYLTEIDRGCNGVHEYVDASEFAQWLRHNEPGVSKEYSQKLAGRTIDVLFDLTKGRLYAKQKNRRKDGLSYKERRVVLSKESEIPGEESPWDREVSKVRRDS